MPNTFQELGVSAELIQGLQEMEIKTPTPIQQEAIPFLVKQGTDLITQAQTGTGKTAAFGLPLLMKIDSAAPEIQALILSPTRELAKQIGKHLFRYTKYCRKKIFIEVAAGGEKMDIQIQRLNRPTHIVVATPGRLMDLLDAGALSLRAIHILVLDEADEMMTMGFKEELNQVFRLTRKRKATWLFSATFQKNIQELVSKNLAPDTHRIKVECASVVNENIEHCYVVIDRSEKDEYIADYLKTQQEQQGLIFCRTRLGSVRLGEELTSKGISVGVLQGELSQRDRDKVMRAFNKKRMQFLIATDVAARGIDIEGLSFVLQHQPPEDFQYYTHRSGRTARAGKSGTSITLIEPAEKIKITRLEKELGIRFRQLK
ncbi:MAG: DEAD/DEAH box helicase [Verrucomicrobiota bacterium]